MSPFLRKEILPRVAVLVDDDPVYQYGVKKLVEQRHINVTLINLSNGQEAIDYLLEVQEAKKKLPDVLLLDINMPEMDGLEFLEEVRTQGLEDLVRRMELYVVTSSIAEEDALQAAASDLVIEYLHKPLSDEKLTRIFHLD